MIFKKMSSILNGKTENVKDSMLPKEDSKSLVSQVKFYSLKEIVKAERILNEVLDGNLIFLNISRITQYPTAKSAFLKALKLISEENNAILKMISEETVMIAPPTLPIEIKTLSTKEENKK